MSKLLLSCKDLLNRTLTRSLLFTVAQLLACLFVLTQAISLAEAIEPLSVKNANPRYFFDSKGNPVYLTGSYLNQYNTLGGSWDFAAYLDFLQQQKQNFTRVWGWEQSPWIYDAAGQISFASQPYERTGPGLALDGGLKFDLTRFNQAYFDELRSRVVQAAQRGIYVSVMLFEGFSTQKKMGRVNPWLSDPFQQANNINGINGDRNRNGSNEELFSLTYPSLLALQEAFVRKAVDTLNDLDNVLYEINGNGLSGSLSWQYHMIDYVKRYQKKTGNQHPVGISDFYAGVTAEVLNSSADWIVIQETNSNPPPATTKKVLIMEGIPPVSSDQALSALPISLFQLLPDSVVSSQSAGTSNNVSSNGVTLLSSSTTSTTLAATQNSSNNQQSQVATPTITPNGGVYSTAVTVTLQTTTPGAAIYYTTDGQSPTQSSRRYTGKFRLSESTLVKAKAFKSNFDPSAEASAWFANAASPAVSPSGLMAYWKFDEGSGISVSDSSGNGNSGTLVNGPVWTAGRLGNALFFDGINDNVTVADSNSLDLSSSFTLSAWVNPASTFTDFRSILVKNYTYFLYASVAGWCGDGSPQGGFTGSLNNHVCQPSPLPINTWTHLAVTYNGSAVTLYRNGVVVATSSTAAVPAPTTGTLQIGASQFGEYFKGLIDEVRIYNRALNDTEIQTVYQQDSATPVQTVATPVISPSGGNYTGSVPVAMQTATSGASIYYTTNGSTPTESSTLYAGTVTLTKSATMKAKAFKSGSNPSAEASASFTVTQPFSFSISNSGDKAVVAGSSVTNSITATLTSGSTQAVTFSTSGLPTGATASLSSASCSPSCSSTLTINTTASTSAGNSTITVTASGGGTTKTTTFGLNVSPQTVATPVISPNGGSFTNTVSVTMQTATSGASIYYTTNGSVPTQSSTLYTGAMTLTSSVTVKAKAFKSGYNPSTEANASFTVSPSDLVAHWKFDEGSGTSVTDSSGNGNSGTLVNGPVWTAGRLGNALFFDGINDNVTVADSNSLDLSSSFTLSAWVNPASTFTDFRSILVKNYTYFLYASVAGWCGDGSPQGGFTGSLNNHVCQPSPLPINTWTHLAVTYNGSAVTLYRNGVVVATSSTAAVPAPTTGTLQIGASQFGEYFKGLIDEVRIYNRALNDTEIQTVYQQDSGVAPIIPSVSQPFSFSLANSGDKSVVAGSSVTNSIAATLVSGSSQAVSFSVSGLPSGATGSFSSSSCTPACSTVLNISTSGSTPAGNFPITITSTGGGGVTRTTAFTLSVTLASTVATPTTTSGATYWVAKTGSDSNSCNQAKSQSTPRQTIGYGLLCLSSGDTLYILPGTYEEGIESRASFPAPLSIASGISASQPTTISAAPGAERQVILAPGYSASHVIWLFGHHRHIKFHGLVLDGGWAPDATCPVSCIYHTGTKGEDCPYVDGVDYYRCGVEGGYPGEIVWSNGEIKGARDSGILGYYQSTFTNMHVHHNGFTGYDHGLYLGGAYNIVENSEINHNSGWGVHLFNNSKYTVHYNTVRNNYIHHNGTSIPNNWYRPGSEAIVIINGIGNKIYNNVVANNYGGSIGIGFSENTEVYNNTIVGNQGCVGINAFAVTPVVRNNICWQNGSGINNQGSPDAVINNNFNQFSDERDPQFVNQASGNYKILTSSPAKDQGTSLSSIFTTDKDGRARPQGVAWDIGAYEMNQ